MIFCLGEVLDIGGDIFEIVGDYILQFIDVNGCDFIVYLMLDYYLLFLYEVEVVFDFGYGDGSFFFILVDSMYILIWEDGSIILECINLQVGFYYVSIEDEWGCVVEIEVEVLGGDFLLVMFNIFMFNGDGVNDFFNVVGNVEVWVAVFCIFNCWGQQVYDNENFVQGWDGIVNGQLQFMEVYYY